MDINGFFSNENMTTMLNQAFNWTVRNIINIVIAIVIWKAGRVLVKMLINFTNKALLKANAEIGVVKFISSILRVVAYAVLIILILDVLGFQTTSLVAVFGSAALAVSMSLQGSLSNFAGGILVMIFKPFKVGDYIIAQNFEGTVVSIEILYTRLRTGDNKIIMMPNGALSNSNIVNVGAEGIRRLDIEVGIGYTSSVTEAKRILLELANGYPGVRTDKEIKAIVKGLNDSCVLLEVRLWVEQDAYWDARFVLLERIKQEFDKNNIEIPYNKLDVNVKTDND